MESDSSLAMSSSEKYQESLLSGTAIECERS